MTERREEQKTLHKSLHLGAIEISLIAYTDEMGPASDAAELLNEQVAALREFATSLEECIAEPLPPHLRAD